MTTRGSEVAPATELPTGFKLWAIVFAAVLGIFVGGDDSEAEAASPTVSSADPVGDCDCDPGLDIETVSIADDGSLVVALGGTVPEGATVWLWPAMDPFTPFALTRTGDGWAVASYALSGSDPSEIFVTETANGVQVHLGYELGAFAATSSAGDRAPDSGYFGPDGTVPSSDAEDSFQLAYSELSIAQRTLAATLVRSRSNTGTFFYDVGISADPDVVHTGTLIVEAGSLEFVVDAPDTRGGHVDRFAISGAPDECLDDADACIAIWMSPFLGVDDLYAHSDSVEVITLVGRTVAGQQVRCVAIINTGSTSLHEGEFCAFDDGTIAFVDDRTAGVILVSTAAPDA